MADTIYDVVIVGGGPAGLSAGIYAGRGHLHTTIVESVSPGGQLFNTAVVENYPGFTRIDGSGLSERLETHARQWGVEFQAAHVHAIRHQGDYFELTTGGPSIWGRTVIIATGSSPRKLGVPGEEELAGRGVSYCATCDGAFFREKDVAVVGGGDAALEESLYLARFVRRVTIIHRRDSLRATKHLQKRAFDNPKIEFMWDCQVEAILGKHVVEKLRVRHKKTGKITDLPVAGVFIYIGTEPRTGFVQGFVKTDPQGYIIAGEDTATSVPGVFAAGDVRTKALRQVVTAVADGAVAAMAAERYLRGQAMVRSEVRGFLV